MPLQEIIAVNLERSLGKVSPFKSAKKNSSTPLKESPIYIELQPLHPVSFSVHVVKRCPNHKWKKKKVTFFCQGENLCRTWVEKIEEALSNPGKLNYSSSSRNFSKLVIFLPNLMNKYLCTNDMMGRKLKKKNHIYWCLIVETTLFSFKANIYMIDIKIMNTERCQMIIFTLFQLTALKRPRSLLVFINPFGGKRRAPRVFEETVSPLLELAKIRTHVISRCLLNQKYIVILKLKVYPYT